MDDLHDLDLDWNKIDALLHAGSPTTEIADHFGIHRNTLYNRCKKDKGLEFCAYSRQKRSKGKAALRLHQYEKALGKTDLGDNTLLIWLGKVRLDQKEPDKNINISPQTIQSFEAIMKAVKNNQDSALIIADNSINKAEKS